jgi:S1-C subfamily serine protease
MARVVPTLVSALLAAGGLAWASSALAQTKAAPRAPEAVPVGFSRLVVRLEGSDEIGIASGDFQVRLIERMRTRGFDAVGAENLVFGKDESRRAEYLVGGTVKELACRPREAHLSCRIGVEWQLLDVPRDQVVYSVMTRAAVLKQSLAHKDHLAALLLDGAMDRLLDRSGFRAALTAHPESDDAAPPAFESATIPRCAPGARVATDANDMLGRVVVVKTHDGFGSGFFVSPEGLVLTAAHVVEGNSMTLRLHDGTDARAVPVRVAAREDVALIRTEKPLVDQRCLPLRTDTASAGAEVYAVGAPASLALAFSLTRGIVSGYPRVADHRRLQTDAPVSPGNSGGPIVDATGAALGVVSFKVTSVKVEGLAFAVPIPEALRALNLHVSDRTGPELLRERFVVEEKDAAPPSFVDEADAPPSLDPEGDALREAARDARLEKQRRAEEQAAEDADRDRRTPGYIPAMKWCGLGLAAVGVAGGIATFLSYSSDTTTQAQFESLKTYNTIAWTAAAVGASSFALSFVLRPLVVPKSALVVAPTGVAWRGAF